MEKSNLLRHAEHELEILCLSASAENRPLMELYKPELLALFAKFGAQGYTPGAADYTGATMLETMKRLLMFQPICPLMGITEEWIDRTAECAGVITFQNTRLATVFKDLKEAWFLDAVTFTTKGGQKFKGAAYLKDGSTVTSSQLIQSFPFKPKTFYIEVYPVPGGDKWNVRDERKLDAVWNYYKKPSGIITE